MENIALLVTLEGSKNKVTTDWRSLAATLQQRGVGDCALQHLHTELRAGLIVSTRGLTLCIKRQPQPQQDVDWSLLKQTRLNTESTQVAGY
ncbi:hypothetical protein [Shewanella sp. YIC-542]|uniref:hypothetical protein n=1 Tax=Shewanella mytili TaxID=3377111 RepID=UPI00398F1170